MEVFKGQIVKDLPADISQELGNIVSRWAYLERLLKQVIYLLVGINETWGRIVIRTDRADGQITMIEDMLTLSSIHWESTPTLTQFKQAIGDIERIRDTLVHGTWISDSENKLRVISIGGRWNFGPNSPRITRRMFPNAPEVTKDSMREVRAQIEQAIESVLQIHERVSEITETWHGKYPSRVPPGHPTDDQSQNKPEGQPPPSEE